MLSRIHFLKDCLFGGVEVYDVILGKQRLSHAIDVFPLRALQILSPDQAHVLPATAKPIRLSPYYSGSG